MDGEFKSALGIMVLRVALGAMLLAHSVLLKFVVYTLDGTAHYFVSIGLPGWLAYLVFWMEAIGGLMLVLGLKTRWVSAAMLPILLGATWAHAGNGWVFTAENGGWEYPLYLSLLAAVQILLGAGAYGFDAAHRKPGMAREAAV